MDAQFVFIRPAPPLAQARALLESVGLPTSDLTEKHMAHFLYCGAGGAPVALVGLELHGVDGLLRSLAVAPDEQGAGLGSALLDAAERHACQQGVHGLYLLTTSAAQFFARRGYQITSRDCCPDSIRSTPQFADLCAESAVILVKELEPAPPDSFPRAGGSDSA
jgi:amino-acid N-acetyltransferase